MERERRGSRKYPEWGSRESMTLGFFPRRRGEFVVT